ncbi:MAG: hypothetical protein HY692_04640, partial [Cyanobacteria bacterium NC_groundwater_1444_Ag_S-0.65um_54_12]|nr:hypothetical protein [Cyanobacteria bacterium NC_groundwater_1444_Ag_S-0.65um_54_12]
AWAVAASNFGGPPEAFVYLSFNNRGMQAIVANDGDPAVAARLNANPAIESLQNVTDKVRREVTAGLSSVVTGAVAPVTPERAAELESARAHPCTYCKASLLCRQKRSSKKIYQRGN